MAEQKLYFKRFWWIVLIVVVAAIFLFFILQNRGGGNDNKQRVVTAKKDMSSGTLAECPADLSGLLTASMVDPTLIAALTPLGNSNPPGHTFPVDHVYFNSDKDKGSIPKMAFYTPGDSVISKIMVETAFDSSGKVIRTTYAIDFSICQGLLVRTAGVTDLVEKVQAEMKKNDGDCKKYSGKHDGEAQIEQCTYQMNYKTKAGEEIGSTGVDEVPEVWAYNYNAPLKANVDWERYNYSDYGYAFCLFDLYKGNLKNLWYRKFGQYNIIKDGKTNTSPAFVPRTAEPICGTVNQNIYGTIQGDWFGEPKKPGQTTEFDGKAIALIHDNINPSIGKLVIGGNISKAGVAMFNPTHMGQINREFSEVKVDGSIYCYKEDQASGWALDGKFLVQLIDDRHLKIENQPGNCLSNEAFKKPTTYER